MSQTVTDARYGHMKYGGSKYNLQWNFREILDPDIVEEIMEIDQLINRVVQTIQVLAVDLER